MKKYVIILGMFLYGGLVFSSGSLDRNFGHAGFVTFGVPGVTGSCMGQGMSLSHDNQLVFGGYASDRGTHGIFLSKYRFDGSLNRAFGNNGTVLTDPSTGSLLRVTSGTPCDWNVVGVNVHQPTGKIIVTSLITLQGRNVGLGLTSYNRDGSLDQSFGNFAPGSKIRRTGALGMSKIYPQAVVVQPNGKIISAGSSGDEQGNHVFTLVRHEANGMLDKNFGKNGIVKFSPFPHTQQVVYSIALQADGKIVTTGYLTSGDLFAIITSRFNGDGSLDETFNAHTSFSSPGYVVATPGEFDFALAFAVTVQPDQKIVVAGYARVPATPTVANHQSSTNLNMVVLRYNRDGSIDENFGNAGMTFIKVGEWGIMPFAVGVQSDDKIVVVGQSTSYDQQGNFDERFATVRLKSDGMLDMTFGPDGTGIVKRSFLDGQAAPRSLVLYGNKIVVGGYAMDTARGFFDSALVQYNQ